MFVLTGVTLSVTAVVAVACALTKPAADRTTAVVSVGTSQPIPLGPTPTPTPTPALAPPPPGFPDLDGFGDVSAGHVGDNQGIYPLATFTGPAGLQCAMWSSLGDTAAYCFGAIPGLDRPANQAYAGDNQKAHFDQTTPPATDKLNGKPLASGQKAILGAGGTLIGGDQITCGAQELVIACMVVKGFSQNHGDSTAERHGFVIDPQKSWTF
jgi:hypothetical protein